MKQLLFISLFACSLNLFSQIKGLEAEKAVPTFQEEIPKLEATDLPILEKDSPKTVIIKDSLFDILLEDYVSSKKNLGYKIQLFSGKSKWEALKIKADFLNKYPDSDKAYIVYHQPNFKLRIGNYIDRFEAGKYLELYKIDYPSAFLVKDELDAKAIILTP